MTSALPHCQARDGRPKRGDHVMAAQGGRRGPWRSRRTLEAGSANEPPTGLRGSYGGAGAPFGCAPSLRTVLRFPGEPIQFDRGSRSTAATDHLSLRFTETWTDARCRRCRSTSDQAVRAAPFHGRSCPNLMAALILRNTLKISCHLNALVGSHVSRHDVVRATATTTWGTVPVGSDRPRTNDGQMDR
jgi:hypothetical protein